MADTRSLDTPPAPVRKRFTWSDVEAMMRAGVIESGGPEELLDGEIWVGGRRRPFTRSEVEALLNAGVLEKGGPEELLDGELCLTPAEGRRHIDLKTWLLEVLMVGKPASARIACDTTLLLSDTFTPSPDFYIFSSDLRASNVRGPDALLVIEIADSSAKKDLDVKGPKYRECGVREYWVIDLQARVTHVHHLDGAWPERSPQPFDAVLTPMLVPGVRVTLADSNV